LEIFEVSIFDLVLQEAEQGDFEAAQKRLNPIKSLPVKRLSTPH